MKAALIKVSGDLFTSEAFLNEVLKLIGEYFVVICVGGGTQINEALAKAGLDIGEHGPLGRETKTIKESLVAHVVLLENQAQLEAMLAERRMTARVVIPVLEIGTVRCHVNGNQFIKVAYVGFDILVVVTTADRVEKKRQEFADLPKIRVIAI